MVNITTLMSTEAFHEAINKSTPSIVFFTAAWNSPSRFIGPIFQSLAFQDQNSRVGYYIVDVDQLQDVAEEAGIRALPTFITFQNGEKIAMTVGANNLPRLHEMVQTAQQM